MRCSPGLTDETFAEVSDRTAIPFEVLVGDARGRRARRRRARTIGSGRSSWRRCRPSSSRSEYGIRPAAVERTLRAWGDSLRRMADVEADLWMSDVMQPLFAAGAGIADIGPRTAELLERPRSR